MLSSFIQETAHAPDSLKALATAKETIYLDDIKEFYKRRRGI